MFCPNCGSTNNDGAAFCNTCGAQLGGQQTGGQQQFGGQQQQQFGQPQQQFGGQQYGGQQQQFGNQQFGGQPQQQFGGQQQQFGNQQQFNQRQFGNQQFGGQQYGGQPQQQFGNQQFGGHQQQFNQQQFGGQQQQFNQPQQFPEPAAAGGAAAVKRAAPVKKIIGLALILAVVVCGVIFIPNLFKKPGDKIVNAFTDTVEKQDSFKVDIAIDYNIDGIADLMGENGDELKEQVKDYGTTTEAQLYISGRDDSFKVRAVWGNLVQAYMDKDGARIAVSNDDAADQFDGFDNNSIDEEYPADEAYDEIFKMVSTRDLDKMISSNKDIESALKEACKGYKDIDKIFMEMLNDKKADYIIKYSSSFNKYTYKIDAVKFVEAFAKNEKLGLDEDIADDVFYDYLGMIPYDIILDLTVKTGGSKLSMVELKINVDDNELGTITAKFSKYGKISDKDMEFEKLSGKITDPILVPSMVGYVGKSKLKSANGNAKTGYVVLMEYLTDKETSGVYNFSGIEGVYDVKRGDGPDAELAEMFKDNMNYDSSDGEIYVGKYGSGDSDYFVQFRKSDSDPIGQYPSMASSLDDENIWGTYTER